MCSPQPPPNSVERALLLCSIVSLDLPEYLPPPSPLALAPPECAISHTSHWDDVQKLLTRVYVSATKAAQELKKVLMDVDVVFKGLNEGFPSLDNTYDTVYRIAGDAIPVHIPAAVMNLPHTYLSPECGPAPLRQPTPAVDSGAEQSGYPVVALGGTFDHLHAGHKILLTMAAWIAREKLIVGITDDALLVRKRYAEALESISLRERKLRAFLTLLNPTLTYDIVPITDVYGPTGWDENIQALVVSKETESGAQAIAKHREEKGLPALQTFVIDVISPTSHLLDAEDEHALRETKMSSTFIRQWIIEQQQQEDSHPAESEPEPPASIAKTSPEQEEGNLAEEEIQLDEEETHHEEEIVQTDEELRREES
ncbi:hypothetical protein BD626DRAFT_569714 [Schizophyllum amplum]|uniref:Cytidyltransferase-like domain-containing protein n=1 Tax=Schizophyllum amplum TaxID=97359 RepID=A0A550CCR5_9AGAR|nr:hypothetical protein BD626DRAFT_569714 [Auriculariopsis ampla]